MSACPTCRAPIADDARFCPRCGVRLDGDASEAATATSVPGLDLIGRSDVDEAGFVSAAPMSSDPSAPGAGRFLPGQMIGGRYRVIGLLGRGGMGEVYRAEDLKLGQQVALKFLPAELERNLDRLERFLNEVRTARQISHPNVCRVYDVGEADGRHFLSMEFVDGEDLATLLRRIGYIPTDKAVQVARQLCAGLAAAHAQGFLHRDLKPANVMLDGNGRVRITDFGLAGLASSFRGAEIRAGTPAYMAPEQLAGESVSVRSDLYSLGLVLYEMCTGRPAFEAADAAEMARLQSESIPASPTTLVASMDPTLERVILRCIESDPARRPASALEVSASLPGGDPLAAALAAGETPSPEMVAAAGGVGALRGWVAGGLLALGVAGVVGLAAAPPRFSLIARVAPPSSPEVLEASARDVVRDFGWTDPVRGRVGRFALDSSWIELRQREGEGPDRFDGIEDVRPAPIYFWYRQSPDHLAPSNHAAYVARTDPPETVAGMTRVSLDPDGRLRSFIGITDVEHRGTEVGDEPDWAVGFRAAGLDLDGAEAIEPALDPRTGASIRRAWRAPWSDRPDERVRVEAGALDGRITYFAVVHPWREDRWAAEEAGQAPPDEGGSVANQVLGLSVLAIVLAGGLFLARRNLRLGRGDRRGATRLSFALGGVYLLSWAITADHVAGLDGVGMLFDAAAYATMIGALAWTVYLALEPYVRRIWPDAAISWSRLLDGRVRDPLVGRDVLIGGVSGVVVACTLELIQWLPVWTGGAEPPPAAPGLGALNGFGWSVGVTLQTALSAAISSVAILFLAVLLSMLLRNRWIAAGVVWLVFTGGQSLAFMQVQSVGSAILLAAVVWTALMFVLLRKGLVAIVALLAFANNLIATGTSVDPTAWSGPRRLAGPVLLVLVLAWAAWTSLAGRGLLQDPLAPAPRPGTRTPS